MANLALLFLTVFSGAQSQLVRFDHLTPTDGLCNSSPNCILQDRDGFLWFATQDGVDRFDGSSFVTYQHDPDDESTLPGNWVDHIVESPCGDLWMFVSVGGMACLARSTDELRRFQASADESGLGLISNEPLSIAFSSAGDVWVGTKSGLNWLRPGQDQWIHLLPELEAEEGRTERAVSTLLLDSRDRLWCGGPDGVHRLDRRRQELRTFELDGSAPVVAALFEDDDHQVWVLTHRGMFLRFDEDTGNFKLVTNARRRVRSIGRGRLLPSFEKDSRGRIWCLVDGGRPLRFDPGSSEVEDPLVHANGSRSLGVGSVVITQMLADRRGDLWFATAFQGLYHYREEQGQGFLSQYSHSPTDSSSILGNEILSLFEDRAGVLWIGIRGRGVSKLDRRKYGFLHVKHDPGRPDSLPPFAVSSLAAAEDGKIWVGTKGAGLHCFDPETAKVEHYLPEPRNPEGLSSGNVTALQIDEQDRLWVGTLESGLNRIDLADIAPDSGLQCRRVLADRSPYGLLSNRISCLARSSGGGIWVGHGTEGLGFVDGESLRFLPLPLPSENPGWAGPSDVLTILEEDDQTLWIGLYGGGLLRMNPRTGEVIPFASVQRDPTAMSDRTVISLLLSRSGDLWVGTYSGGLNLLDRATRTFAHYTQRHGLPSNMINGMVEGGTGSIWLATNRGLSRFDPLETTFQNFTQDNGPQGFEYTTGAATIDRNGNILVGGEHGFDLFHPERLERNGAIPPVVITSFKKFDEELLRWGADLSAPIVLTHRDNFLSFEFAVLDFANPGGHRHRFRLEPAESSWREAGDRRFASYTNLPPGEYVFRVAGANDDGIWNREGASLSFVIVPPFWRTGWFRAGAGLSVVFLVLLAYWLGVRGIKLLNFALEASVKEKTAQLTVKNEELRSLSEDKSELIRIAAHEIRTPLTSISAYLDLTIDSLQQDRGEIDETIADLNQAQRAAIRVSRLLGGMLDAAAIEDGKLKLRMESVDVAELLLERSLFHRRVAEKKGIRLRCEAAKSFPRVTLDQDRIGEVLDNLLSNAIKFTHPEGCITVSALVFGDEVRVQVRDTGPGLGEQDLRHVFKRFRRLSARPTGGEDSTGLGLAIVKKIIELHGGTVGVESRQGEGATFFFSLPVQAVSPEVV